MKTNNLPGKSSKFRCMNSFGEILRSKRKEKNLSQERFADLLEIGQEQLTLYELGKSVPREDILSRITEELGMANGALDRHLYRPFPTLGNMETQMKIFLETNTSQRDWLMLFELLQTMNEDKDVLSGQLTRLHPMRAKRKSKQ